ncbi:MAG: DegV family protein [Lachnospiraceae bacterium]|nr:DegV family protein [Lachnospiraceae bacterium]
MGNGKKKVKIVADSSCDLSKELQKRFDISILPMNVVLDLKSYCDGEEITPDEIYAWAEKNKKAPKTAAVGFDRAFELMQEFKHNGEDVIFIGLSETMSNTCNVLKMVKDELEYDRMFVVDSKSLSTGIGLQVIRAAQMAQEGKSAEEIVAQIEADRSKVRASFVVERLDYLAMGGRCSSVTALMGTALKLKPRIEVADGRMFAGKKYRGPQDKVILKYVEEMKDALLLADPERIFITHSGCSEEVIERVKTFLEDFHRFQEIHVVRAGAAISSHCGPQTLGVLFYES